MSDKLNDGGPAFPVLEDRRHSPDWNTEVGMSLRDYFAAKAMQWICAPNPVTGQYPGPNDFPLCARSAYDMADKMLKAREA